MKDKHCSTVAGFKVLPSKLDRFLSTIDDLWDKIATLIEFREFWYFNAKVRYYCYLDIFYTVLSWGGRNYVEKNSSFMFK